MMRILGLDYGSKTVGVAVSDPSGTDCPEIGDDLAQTGEQASPDACPGSKNWSKEYEVEKIVLGYPKNMNNTVGERAEKVSGI